MLNDHRKQTEFVMEILIVPLMYLVVFGVIGFIGWLFYLRTLGTRKSWVCPKCGESITTDHMEASFCSSCGTELTQEMKR